MVRPYRLFIVPLALAACNQEPTVSADNASIAEVSAATSRSAQFEPGEWETNVTFASVDLPGMPPQVAGMMKDQIAKQMTRPELQQQRTCLTAEQAAKPPGEMFGGRDNGCRFEHFRMGGGKLDAVMVCKDTAGGPGDARMTMKGNVAPGGYDLASEMIVSSPAMPGVKGDGGMTIRTRVTGKRIGDCTAGKAG